MLQDKGQSRCFCQRKLTSVTSVTDLKGDIEESNKVLYYFSSFVVLVGLRMSIIDSLDFERYLSFITINFDLSLLQNAYYLKTI